MSFGVTADPDLYPVSSTFDVGVGVYASNDEREVPTVTIPDSGPPEVDGADKGGATDARITVIPLTATKAETANPVGEVYRGPDNPATFTIMVQTAPDAGTAGVVVTDLVPATFTVTDCDNACAMEVVTVDGEVFTQLTWNLGDLPDAATRVLTYHAFVDVREVNDGVLPGPPTRPSGIGDAVTNTVASLTVGQTATLALTVHVAESARGELVNVASVSSDADPTPSTASAAAVVIVTVMPDTGGYLGLYLPFGVAMLRLGAAALWWSRRRKVDAP